MYKQRKFLCELRACTELFIVDARTWQGINTPCAAGNRLERVNKREPCHVVVEVLGCNATKVLPPTVQETMLGVDVLNVVHTSCAFILAFILA
ncbi:hypothetical protein SAMN05443507_12032 [Alicyclobacillus tolerans]|uniref:Uncharacterized protein n=1 Tax=Alicyclobacillus tolerans TaxID=90970 RepID=A0A1M6ULZ6_9BACL|nr:hypothetical protein SAMN05443507_12032 [Alicyclobacillus montanus]